MSDLTEAESLTFEVEERGINLVDNVISVLAGVVDDAELDQYVAEIQVMVEDLITAAIKLGGMK
jgi:hypothetical protein